MLFTASTVLDSVANVKVWVHDNLAMGIDHMVVFLDSPWLGGQAEVYDFLAAHPHVTAVRTNRQYWLEERPPSLNVRQRINMNLAAQALATVPGEHWLIPLDGDEVFASDRAFLESQEPTTSVVQLRPLEAVSTYSPQGRPTQFKHLLEEADLTLLRVLDVIPQLTNMSYFRGHVMGRSAIRLNAGLRLSLHEAIDAHGKIAERVEDPRGRILHYDAISGEEFVRKWQAMLAAGPVKYRAKRAPTARAIAALSAKELAPETVEKYLRRIYDITTADDVQTLHELGLLIDIDPSQGTYVPSDPGGETAARVQRLVDELLPLPKMDFHFDKRVAEAPERGRAREVAGAVVSRLRSSRMS